MQNVVCSFPCICGVLSLPTPLRLHRHHTIVMQCTAYLSTIVRRTTHDRHICHHHIKFRDANGMCLACRCWHNKMQLLHTRFGGVCRHISLSRCARAPRSCWRTLCGLSSCWADFQLKSGMLSHTERVSVCARQCCVHPNYPLNDLAYFLKFQQGDGEPTTVYIKRFFGF